jgi:hypothetical protein
MVAIVDVYLNHHSFSSLIDSTMNNDFFPDINFFLYLFIHFLSITYKIVFYNKNKNHFKV